MKKKALLFVSVVAILLSVVMIIAPASASVTSHCTDCTKLVGPTVVEVSTCRLVGIDGCECPLPPPLLSNNCFFVGAQHQK